MDLDLIKPLIETFLLFFHEEGILVVVLTMGITEFLKHIIKHTDGMRALFDWEIRGLAMIIAVFFSSIVLTNLTYQFRLIHGLFYGITAPTLYLIGKRYIIDKYLPSVGDTLSGQETGGGNVSETKK